MQKSIPSIVALLLVACGGADAPRGAPPASTSSAPSPMSGEDAYRHYCADCHDSGEDGAPVTGKRSDWAGTSPLWQAVLMEHAKRGYLKMPAKGGYADIPDSTIDAAVEYMLELTYPDLPPDQ